jgi:hypothetical protein
MIPLMKISREELARRLAEADRQVVLLRQATRDMQAVRKHVLEDRRRELERSRRDSAARR